MIMPAGLAHAATLAAIHRAAFPARESWGADAFAMQLALPGVFGLLDESGGVLLARVATDEVELLTLAVVPTARRQGIGRGLLNAAMRQAALHGAQTMVLEVSETNEPARALYGAAGFVAVGRRKRYYADGTDALILRAALDSYAAATG